MLTVFISNQNIRAALGEFKSGKAEIQKVYTIRDESGCVVNGRIVDAEALKTLLTNFWNENNLPKKQVSLILDSAEFTVRAMEIPKLNRIRTAAYVEREFGDVSRIDDPVCGYFLLPGQEKPREKLVAVYATVASRKYLLEYDNLFLSMGIRLERIETARSAAVRLSGYVAEGKAGAYVVQYVEGNALINVLMVNGKHYYSNRNRLYSEPGTIQYSIDIARSVSNLLQFSKAQNLQEEISEIYVAGIDQEDFALYADSVQRIAPELNVDWMDLALPDGVQNAELTGYAINLGGMLKTPISLGLRAQLHKVPERDRKIRKVIRLSIPAVITAVVLLIVAAVVGSETVRLEHELSALQAVNESGDVVEAAEAYDEVYRQLRQIRSNQTGVEMLTQTAMGYPVPDSGVAEAVAACAEGLVTAEISDYDAETGMMSLEITAEAAEDISRFVKKLEEEASFAAVDYTGYTQTGTGIYSVKVHCTLAGREVEQP